MIYLQKIHLLYPEYNKQTTYGYDKNGNLLTQTDWLGNVFTNKYDPLNRLTEKIDPYNKTTVLQYVL